MDVKALAKSKRAHSLHNTKKHNVHQASKAPSASSGDKKPTGKLPKQKPQQSDNARPLPSNWDRYSEDFELGSRDALEAGQSQPVEFVAPKSKGADYSHLISEAKGQAQASYPSDVFSFSDDNVYNFTQDFGPMLAAKGQDMFSWIEDDGFEVESNLGSNLEVPFLSLNLNALAEQLAKAKLSERLFIEADVLPLELLDNELPAFGEDKQDPQTRTSVPIASGKDDREPLSSCFTMSENLLVQTAEEGPDSMKQSKDEKPQSMERINSDAGNPSTFETASAEAELDMLLNSFTETKIFELPPGASSTRISSKGTYNTGPATKPAGVDGSINGLLEETSSMIKTDPDNVSSSTDQPGSKSKLLDDFDSWLDTI